MATIEVTIDLPFYLRVENALTVSYENVCQEAQVPELVGHTLEVTFTQRAAGQINRMSWPKVQYVRTTVGIKVATPSSISEDSVGTFAIRNCLEILNRVITSYQATTREVGNAGFIEPVSTSDMQLFAEIRVNGNDIRDRWPGHNINTVPLSAGEAEKFEHYLIGKNNLPLSRLFLTNATLSLERGQYALAVLQAATAVELRVTQVVSGKLQAAGWSSPAVKRYEDKTLGGKLQIPKTDPRSLETYYGHVGEFPRLYSRARQKLTPLRNKVIHRGYLPSHEEALEEVKMASEFLKVVG